MVTKYRRHCLNKKMLEELKCIAQKQLEMKEGSLLEFNGEEDHNIGASRIRLMEACQGRA
jgi:REP element-mobilizing transposase RayT